MSRRNFSHWPWRCRGWHSEITLPHNVWSGARSAVVPWLHWLLEGIDIGIVQRHPQRLDERVA